MLPLRKFIITPLGHRIFPESSLPDSGVLDFDFSDFGSQKDEVTEESNPLFELNLDWCADDGIIYRPNWVDKFGFHDHQQRYNQETVNLLESEMPQDVRSWNFLPADHQILGQEDAWVFRYREIELWIEISSTSDTFLLPPKIINSQANHKKLSRNACDTIGIMLSRIVHQQGPFLSSFREVTILILRLLEETTWHLTLWRRRPYVKIMNYKNYTPYHPLKSWDWVTMVENPHGVDLNCIADTAFHILQKTPKQICEDFPPEYRVLHVESVLRADLAERFLQSPAELRWKLRARPWKELSRCVPPNTVARGTGHEVEDTIEYLCKPNVTFHGTRAQTIDSIVRYGFTRPGSEIGATRQLLEVRCGNTYGRGIYVSPDPEFSMMYCVYGGKGLVGGTCGRGYSMRMLICATIMGRSRKVYREDKRRDFNKPMEGYDSHMANHDLEYIIFKPARVLPCYVVHFDNPNENWDPSALTLPVNWGLWKATKAKKKDNPVQNRLNIKLLAAGDKVREKERMHAAALKHFPFGYGTATGTRFVVLEIAEVSEDEEEYGEDWYEKAKERKALEAKRRAKLEVHNRHLAINTAHKELEGEASLFDEHYVAANTDKALTGWGDMYDTD